MEDLGKLGVVETLGTSQRNGVFAGHFRGEVSFLRFVPHLLRARLSVRLRFRQIFVSDSSENPENVNVKIALVR